MRSYAVEKQRGALQHTAEDLEGAWHLDLQLSLALPLRPPESFLQLQRYRLLASAVPGAFAPINHGDKLLEEYATRETRQTFFRRNCKVFEEEPVTACLAWYRRSKDTSSELL